MITANQRRLKVGVLTPHAAAGPEIEIPDMSQGRVTVTVARIRAPKNAAGTESTGAPAAPRALTRPEAVDGDAACFGDGSVDVVAHATTTTGYVLGVRSEAELIERLATKCAVPVVGSAGAAADALRGGPVHGRERLSSRSGRTGAGATNRSAGSSGEPGAALVDHCRHTRAANN
jgi:maleate cis-trans isomerase